MPKYVADVRGPRLANEQALVDLGFGLIERLGHCLWLVESPITLPPSTRVQIEVNETRILFLQGLDPEKLRIDPGAPVRKP